MQANRPNFWRELGEFLERVLAALVEFRQTEQYQEISYRNQKIALPTCDVVFQIIWKLLQRPPQGRLQVLIEKQEQRRYFLLTVDNGRLMHFQECLAHENFNWRLCICLTRLQKLTVENELVLLWELCQQEALCWERQGRRLVFEWCRAWRLSGQALLTFWRWLLPARGIGLVLALDGVYLPLILKGGQHVNLDCLLPRRDTDLASAATWLADHHQLWLVLALQTERVLALLQGSRSSSQVSPEGQDYYVHIGNRELNIYYQTFKQWLAPQLAKVPLKRDQVWALVRQYLANAQHYIQQRPLYLVFFENQEMIVLKLHEHGVTQCQEHEPPLQDTFFFNIGWLQQLREWAQPQIGEYTAQWVQTWLPPELLIDTSWEEAVGHLLLEDESGQALHLYFTGGSHYLPCCPWHGDSFWILLQSHGDKILQAVSMPQCPLLIMHYPQRLEINFGCSDILVPPPLIFSPVRSTEYFQGPAYLLSFQPALARVVPGYHTVVTLYQLVGRGKLRWDDKEYKITDGNLVLANGTGKMLPAKGAVHYLRHLWLQHLPEKPASGGLISAGYSVLGKQAPVWWQRLLKLTTAREIYLQPSCIKQRSLAQVLEAPRYNHFSYPTEDLGISFTLIEAWAWPYQQQNTTMVRIKAFVKNGAHKGFANLEFPSTISPLAAYPLPLEIRTQGQEIKLVYQDIPVLRLERGDYLELAAARFMKNFQQRRKILLATSPATQ